jgi:hypothetical protein
MDLTAEAIGKILEVSNPVTLEIDDRSYASKGLVAIQAPIPAPISVHTLTAVEDYLKSNFDGDIQAKGMILVKSFGCLRVQSAPDPKSAVRTVFIQASAQERWQPGQFATVEQFIITLQTEFIQDETTAAILKIVGNLTDNAVANFKDDGTTQQVQVKRGISMAETAPVPNPVTLRPYRTFLEIEQPSSLYVFRMRGAENGPPTCALFQADGAGWRLEAIKRIKQWFKERFPDMTILG